MKLSFPRWNRPRPSGGGPDASSPVAGEAVSLPTLDPVGPELLPVPVGVDAERGFVPDVQAIERVREVVVAEFRARAAGTEARVAAPRSRLDLRAWRLAGQPIAAVLLATILVVASVGFVAANSGPGDAFYGLRLAAEDLNLPFLGSSSRLDRMQQRLDEASSESSNAKAVSAALQAYQDELRQTIREVQTDDQRQAVLDVLGAHKVVLDELAQDVPPAADAGLQAAREQIGEAEQNLAARPSPPPLPSVPPTPERSLKPAETHRPSGR